MKNKLLCWGALVTLVFLWLPLTAAAADEPVGVAYRGHIQDRGDYPLDGSWIDSPAIIGTTGQSKRIEGFEIKLTGDVPEAMELRYNVHVQNKGWLYDENDSVNWPKDGAYAGTRGNSLRIEAVKIVLTDSEGNAVPGYAVQYRGHVQNIGDLPKDQSEWLADGAQLGTVGSSLRLEALLVQVVRTAVDPPEPVVYDSADTYGPTTGSETIAGDVTVTADGVTLQNLAIAGNLTIGEAVGDGNVTLNNVTVAGDTFVRGGGKNSIHLNGGSYARIVMEKTASGAVRIVATGVDGLAVVVTEDAAGETIILEGAFASVTVNAPNMTVTIQGNTTTIGTMSVGTDGAGSTLNLAAGTTVTALVLDGKAAVKGQGAVTKADVNADGVVFDKKPGSYVVEPAVVIPPVFPPEGGGSGGGPTSIAVTAVSLNKTAIALAPAVTDKLTAMVAPAGATNKALSWSSSADSIATVDGSGTVTAISEGTATITVTTADGHKQATCTVVVKDLKQTIAGVTVPFAGETPVAAITSTSQLSGTVSWQKKDGSSWTDLAAGEKFDGTSSYLATITLTIKAPYTAADIPGNFFAVAGATASNDAGSLVVTAEFLPTHQYKITAQGLITAYSGPGGLVAVPATVNDITVTGIGIEAFKNQTTITAITLPATVTTIQEAAFSGCGGLTAVTFNAPAGLQTIGAKAFNGCAALTGIAIPDAVKSIGFEAFSGCTKLATVTISANAQLESIEGKAFFNCSALTAINIPQKVTSLGDSAFQTCGALDTITIAGNLTAIGTYTFWGCQALTVITLPESITSIGYGAFSFCGNLTSIAIPQKVTALGPFAFDNCLELKTVTFTGTPTLTTIGDNAFNNCLKLSEIEIPKTVKALGNFAFKNCPALTTITFRGPTPTLVTGAIAAGTTIRHYGNYSGYDGWTGMIPVHILAEPVQTVPQISNFGSTFVTVNWSPVANADKYDVFVREAAGSYGAGAIASAAGDAITADITGLDSSKSYYFVVKARDAYGESLPSNEQCADLNIKVTAVTLTPAAATLIVGASTPVTVTVAPANAANKGIAWSSSDETIATVDNSGVVKALAPGVVTITAMAADGSGASGSCTVTVKPVIETSAVAEGVTISKYNGGTGPLVIPAEINGQPVVAIADGAFARTMTQILNGDFGPSSVVIPASVKSIGKQAFRDCVMMTSLTFAGNSELTAIGDQAFQGCQILNNVVIPDSVDSIGVSAFMQCIMMTDIDLGQVQTIGGRAFWQCTKLTAIIIPNTVTSMEEYVFYQCTQLQTVNFEATSTLTSIGNSAFQGSGLTSIALPDSVTSLGSNTFFDCTDLAAVTLPAGLSVVKLRLFYNCPNLTTITLPATVTTIESLAFNGDAGKLPSSRTITFLGNAAPGTVATDAIYAGTVIKHPSGASGFDLAKFPSCTFVTYEP